MGEAFLRLFSPKHPSPLLGWNSWAGPIRQWVGLRGAHWAPAGGV